MDKLIVSGLRQLDGEYDLDLRGLLSIGSAGALNTREQHKIKLATGVLPANLPDAVGGLDASVMVQLASVVLTRQGKTVNEDRLWEARFVYTSEEMPDLSEREAVVVFLIADRSAVEADDSDPPAVAGTTSQSGTGGGSLSQSSDQPVSDQSPTGPRLLATPTSGPGSDQETLAS